MAKSNVAQFAEKLKMPVASLLEQLQAAGVRKKTAEDAITESYMHIEVDQDTEPSELDLMCKSIEQVLADVRVAVADWRTMRQRLQENVGQLEAKKLPMPPEEVDEAKAFLKWLDEGDLLDGHEASSDGNSRGHGVLPVLSLGKEISSTTISIDVQHYET